jgi:hypothetical protein
VDTNRRERNAQLVRRDLSKDRVEAGSDIVARDGENGSSDE